ncbi:MAG TPA: hypothetical protein VEQ62_20275 [Stellaceae bacterium]|jgi:hypothetical protein|nr:hypothetical protein [Stellaceae bacterium]
MTIRIAVPAIANRLLPISPLQDFSPLQDLPIGGSASQGVAIPLSTAENSVYAPENCRVGIKNPVKISLLNASGRTGRQRKSGAGCAGRQRTGSGIQQHGLALLNRHVM